MSQIYKNNSGGGSGTLTGIVPQFQADGVTSPGSTITNVTPDIFGLKAASAQVTDTINSTSSASGILEIEDRTWWTPYVVDASTTPGTRGTFSTIASAISAAVTDGASITDAKIIFIRSGLYIENLTIPNGIILQGFSCYNDNIDPVSNIEGNHIISSARCELINLNLTDNNGDTITISGGSEVTIINCIIENTSSHNGINQSGGTTTLSNSNIQGNITVSGGNLTLLYCVTPASTIVYTASAGSINARHTELPYSHVLSGTGSFQYEYCTFLNSGTSQITGSSSSESRIINCEYTNTAAVLISATAPFVTQNTFGKDASDLGVYNANPTIYGSPSIQGNILTTGLVTTSSYTTHLWDYYLGVNYNGAVAITLTTTNLARDRIIIFKDQSGAAATNNITITPASGTIDGKANFVMNSNYQSITLKFDGTNFWVL